MERTRKYLASGVISGLAALGTGCSTSRDVESYSFLGHGTFDATKKPISTNFPPASLLESLVDRGICADEHTAQEWITNTGLNYDSSAFYPTMLFTSDTLDKYGLGNSEDSSEPVVVARLHQDTLMDAGTVAMPHTLFYISPKSFEDLTIDDARCIADSQKGLRVIPIDYRVPALAKENAVSLQTYNDLWNQAHSLDANAEDKARLEDVRDVDSPLNFAPIGTTFIVRTFSADRSDSYSALKIVGNEDLGTFDSSKPFAQDFHKGWITKCLYQRFGR